LGLAGVLGQAGKLYTASAPWIVIGVLTWTAFLVGGILLMAMRLNRAIHRIRLETGTTDDMQVAQGKTPSLPKYFESETRFLGLPLFAIAWGGTSSDSYRLRTVCAWVAVGDIAISPFLAAGAFAAAPISLGAVTLGIFSLSVFWGVAVG